MKTRQEKREENAMIAGYSFIIALLILLLLGCIKLLNTAWGSGFFLKVMLVWYLQASFFR